jgi:hypothetical protein
MLPIEDQGAPSRTPRANRVWRAPAQLKWRASLAAVRSKLKKLEVEIRCVGPTSASERAERTPVRGLSSTYGIGAGTVEALAAHGFVTLADLRNEIITSFDLEQIFGVGPDKARLILDWAEAEAAQWRTRAGRSAARLRDLRSRHAELLGQLAELSKDR